MTYLFSGTVLVCAIIALWRKDIKAIIYSVAFQGVALGIVGFSEGLSRHDLALVQAGIETFILKGIVFPILIFRIFNRSGGQRDVEPLINTTASMLYTSLFIGIPFFSIGRLPYIASSPQSKLVPIGFATLLVGFYILITRRRIISQIVGLIIFENGISLIAFLLISGLPLLVELGESLDVLLVVIVLRVLAITIQSRIGNVDLAEMKELHD